MSETKFCINCKHARSGPSTNTIECRHPENLITSLVTGHKSVWRTAESLRYYNQPCGHEGKWFEPTGVDT